MGSNKNRIARREFLTAVGHAAGSSALVRTMVAMGLGATAAGCGSSSAANGAVTNPPAPPPPPPSALVSPRPGDWPASIGNGRTVTILGGGIAGMTAALEMSRLGYSCTILEATARAGGRNRTIRSGDVLNEIDSTQTCQFDLGADLYFNPGPARIPHHHEFLLAYCREFGVTLETFVNDNRAALLHSTTAFGGQPVTARRLQADSRGNIARLLALAVNQGALDQELSITDKVNIVGMLAQFGALNGLSNYGGSSRAGFPGQENAGSRQRGSLLTPLALQDLISETFFAQRLAFAEGLNQQPTMLQPVGGMDQIANAFAAEVAADLVTQAEVLEIRKIAAGTRVTYQDRFGGSQTLDADYCICTIPATVLRNIPNDFSAAHQSEIASFNYTAAGKIAFQSRRFWEQDHNIYGGISWTTQEITQIWYPNNGFGQSDGIIVGAYIFGGGAGTNFANQSPQARIDSALTQGSAVHSQMSSANNGISIAWSKVPYQIGAWGTSTPTTLLTADDNIFFAGEHLSILQGWQEGAILSAYHAIDLVVARDTV